MIPNEYLLPKDDNTMETRCILTITTKKQEKIEVDVTDMPVHEIARTIEVQEILGREWKYKWI